MSQTKDDKYKLLVQQIDGLLNPEDPLVTNVSNFVAAIKQTFSKISWIGFYLKKDEYLYLGPFQGKVACTKIKIGNGVCGTAAKEKITLVVPNVHEFSGHIACDVESNSEIVVPVIKDDEVFAVLDIDSTEFSTFDETDKKYLEDICRLFISKLKLNYNLIN